MYVERGIGRSGSDKCGMKIEVTWQARQTGIGFANWQAVHWCALHSFLLVGILSQTHRILKKDFEEATPLANN